MNLQGLFQVLAGDTSSRDYQMQQQGKIDDLRNKTLFDTMTQQMQEKRIKEAAGTPSVPQEVMPSDIAGPPRPAQPGTGLFSEDPQQQLLAQMLVGNINPQLGAAAYTDTLQIPQKRWDRIAQETAQTERRRMENEQSAANNAATIKAGLLKDRFPAIGTDVSGSDTDKNGKSVDYSQRVIDWVLDDKGEPTGVVYGPKTYSDKFNPNSGAGGSGNGKQLTPEEYDALAEAQRRGYRPTRRMSDTELKVFARGLIGAKMDNKGVPIPVGEMYKYEADAQENSAKGRAAGSLSSVRQDVAVITAEDMLKDFQTSQTELGYSGFLPLGKVQYWGYVLSNNPKLTENTVVRKELLLTLTSAFRNGTITDQAMAQELATMPEAMAEDAAIRYVKTQGKMLNSMSSSKEKVLGAHPVGREAVQTPSSNGFSIKRIR